MEPVTLAAEAVTALAPYLGRFAQDGLARLSETAADGAVQRVAELYRTIRARVTGHPYEQAVLDGAEAQPDNESRLGALRDALAGLLRDDPDFATELAGLLGDRTYISAVESGTVAGGDIHQQATYIANRDINIGNIG